MTRRADTESDRELLLRCDELMRSLDRLCVDRFEPIEGGTAALTPSLPLVWADNFVIFEEAGLEAERMAELCEQALGGAGLAHRMVMTTDPDEDERVEPGFREMGWEVVRDDFMVSRADPGRPAAEVREVPYPVELRRALRHEDEDLRDSGPLDEVVEQLLASERRLSAAEGDRWFVADADGAPATTTRLLTQGGLSLIDAVGTLRSARNRGLARATVQEAVRASRAQGDELVFLLADADDWPRGWYEKLGFAPIGTFLTFRKPSDSGDTAGNDGD
jgi:GNAT superfamily N-acetyltransferase